MKRALRDRLSALCRAVEIKSADSFSFAGRPFSIQAATQQPVAAGQPQANPQVERLLHLLYEHGYCRLFDGEIPDDPASTTPDETFVSDLSKANTSRERWEAGWVVQRVDPSGQVVAGRFQSSRGFLPGEVVSQQAHGTPLQPGTSVSVFLGKESWTLQPGFYFVFGEESADQQDELSPARLYFNVRSGGAAALVSMITRRLNRLRIPFRFKTLTIPGQYDRLDSAVLFIGKRFFHITADLLSESYAEVADWLEPDVPLFSKPLAPGLGLAEDPGSGESFGLHRCRLLAEAIWIAASRGDQSVSGRLGELVQHLQRNGLDAERPHLNPGSADRYDFPQPEPEA